MKDTALYRQLASGGNPAAARILDAEGATPEAEMTGESSSEAMELAELEDLQARVDELVAKAAAHTESGDCMRSADAHVARAALFESVGRHKRAMGAYKDAVMSLFQHSKDYGMVPRDGCTNIHAAHAIFAAAKAGGR